MAILAFGWYIRYIQWPHTIMKYKKKGYVFSDLEQLGWVDDWDEEEEEMSLDMTIGDI